MATHYEVLGVSPNAALAQIRRAYVARARALHPDGHGDASPVERAAASRAMQEVNEAWRILRAPGLRAAYDRALEVAPPTTSSPVPTVDGAGDAAAPAPTDDDGLLDRPYPSRFAEPGDVTIAIVRAAPWVAALIVLAAIVVFTAFAKRDGAPSLIGRCLRFEGGTAVEQPCDAPNDGRVVQVVEQAIDCRTGTVARVAAGGTWYCLRPPDADQPTSGVLRIDRLSSAKPGKAASVRTVSQSRTASSPVGAFEITGPKKL